MSGVRQSIFAAKPQQPIAIIPRELCMTQKWLFPWVRDDTAEFPLVSATSAGSEGLRRSAPMIDGFFRQTSDIPFVHTLISVRVLVQAIIGAVRGDETRTPSVCGDKIKAAVGGLHPRGNEAKASDNALYDQILEASRQLNLDREIFVPATEERQPTHIGVGIRITHPPKYSVCIVGEMLGEVVVNFETLGFVPSAATPIEVSRR